MRCDVLAVGTELLLGQIVDTNSSWLGENLAMHGFDSLSQVKVGDNIGRITGHLRRMLDEADAVIMCGGLGPTHDDLTREAIADVMGVDLHLDEDVADVIRYLFTSRNRTMPENNLRQRWCLKGFHHPSDEGYCSGFDLSRHNRHSFWASRTGCVCRARRAA